MGQISSINFKKSNVIQTQHNDRILSPSYLIGGDFEVNQKSKEALKLKNQIIENAKEKYTRHTGQKCQAKSYEWSAVCNIKPTTTMQELEKLAKHFSDKYGFQCYQIAIHRDEGHLNEKGEKEINHHAHLEFITLDKDTGINNFKRSLITPKVLREIQSEVAKILQMRRGIDRRISGAKRIEPRMYAKIKEEEKAQIREIKAELITQKEINQRIEKERKAWILEGGHIKEEYAKLRKLKEQDYKKIEDLEQDIQNLKQEKENIVKFQTESAQKSKKDQELIQNLEKEKKSLKIDLLEQKKENKLLKRKIRAIERLVEYIYKTPNHLQYAYKSIIEIVAHFYNKPDVESLKATSFKNIDKEFKKICNVIAHNVEMIKNAKGLSCTQKDSLTKEARHDGLSLENKKIIEQAYQRELEKDKGFSR